MKKFNNIYSYSILAISLDLTTKKEKKKSIQNDEQLNMSIEVECASNESVSSFQSMSDDSSNSLSIDNKIDKLPINDIHPDICSSEIESIDVNQQLVEFSPLDDCAMSDSSSDTVDYDFDTDKCATLTFESQESIIPLSTCDDV